MAPSPFIVQLNGEQEKQNMNGLRRFLQNVRGLSNDGRTYISRH